MLHTPSARLMKPVRRETAAPLARRGMLIHMTHYCPSWDVEKSREQRFSFEVAQRIMQAMAEAGMNFLMVDIKDAVIYKSHPELKKRYSVPMRELKQLGLQARRFGLEIVPKLNFSKSPRHRHSAWLLPKQARPDDNDFWRMGFDAIDEVCAALDPKIVHVGMDEDDTRSPGEYLDALQVLYRGLKKRKRRMAIWAEVGHPWRPQERWKEIPAIEKLPRDVLLMPWLYYATPAEWVRRLADWGFEVVGACGYTHAGRSRSKRTRNARDWVQAARGNGASGVVLTQWIKCRQKNRRRLLQAVAEVGPVLSGNLPVPPAAT